MIKAFPEDFVVRELPAQHPSGRFLKVRACKRDISHFDMVSLIGEVFSIDRRMIGAAGIKDKRALTEQYLSLPAYDRIRLPFIHSRGEAWFMLEHAGSCDRISAGMLLGNRFEILMRDEYISVPERVRVANYFGDQRFSKQNHEVGYALVRNEWDRACSMLGLGSFNDLRGIDRRIRQMYVSSLQSLIFNVVLNSICRDDAWSPSVRGWGALEQMYAYQSAKSFCDEPRVGELPIVAIGAVIDDRSRIMMDALGLSDRSFVIRQMNDLILEPTMRTCFLEVDVQSQKILVGTHLEFSLPKGSYATVLVDRIRSLSG